MSFKITFLGTGGGRHSAMYQTRCTGGMLIEHGGHFLHVDPGPGALTQMKNIHYDPADTDSIIISHAHPDHYSDAEVAIEGMTHGGWTRRGHVYGSATVIEGRNGLGPCLSEYHKNIAESTAIFKPGDVLDIDGLRTEICYADHSDPTNVGFRFVSKNGIASYVSDTQYSDELADQYVGSRILILPVTAPNDTRIKYHLCTSDAVRFIKRVLPELTIFVHLGIVMIYSDPGEQARIAENESGCKVIAGEDLMTVEMNETLTLGKAETFTGIWFPPSAPLNPHR